MQSCLALSETLTLLLIELNEELNIYPDRKVGRAWFAERWQHCQENSLIIGDVKLNLLEKCHYEIKRSKETTAHLKEQPHARWRQNCHREDDWVVDEITITSWSIRGKQNISKNSRKKHCWQHPGNSGQRSLLKEDQEGRFHATDQSSHRQVGGTCRWKSTRSPNCPWVCFSRSSPLKMEFFIPTVTKCLLPRHLQPFFS